MSKSAECTKTAAMELILNELDVQTVKALLVAHSLNLQQAPGEPVNLDEAKSAAWDAAKAASGLLLQTLDKE